MATPTPTTGTTTQAQLHSELGGALESESLHETTAATEDPHVAEGGLAVLGIDTPFIIAQVINFFILLFLLRWLLYRPILDMLRKRRDTIEQSLKHAEQAKLEAESAEQRTAELLLTARTEAKGIVDGAKAQAETLTVQLKQAAADEAEALLTRTRAQLEQEKQAVLGDAERALGDLVAKATERVLAGAAVPLESGAIEAAIKEVKGK